MEIGGDNLDYMMFDTAMATLLNVKLFTVFGYNGGCAMCNVYGRPVSYAHNIYLISGFYRGKITMGLIYLLVFTVCTVYFGAHSHKDHQKSNVLWRHYTVICNLLVGGIS